MSTEASTEAHWITEAKTEARDYVRARDRNPPNCWNTDPVREAFETEYVRYWNQLFPEDQIDSFPRN